MIKTASVWRRRALSAVALLAVSPSAFSAITFDFTFSGADWTAQRKGAVETAASSFSTLFGQYFDYTAEIDIDATSSDVPMSSRLASAGSRYTYLTGNYGNTSLTSVVANKIQTGVDLNGSGADGLLDVNFGKSWQLDKNAAVGAGEFDFYSTIYHELMHALGFASTFEANGDPLVTSDGNAVTGGHYSIFDSLIVDKNGLTVINPDGTLNTSSDFASGVTGGVDDGLFFNGANAKAANGGNAVGLYTPSPYSDGSSVSHVDGEDPFFNGYLMLPSTTTGPGTRTLTAIEVGMLQDIGYTSVTAVPLPAAFWMMLPATVVVLRKFSRNRESQVA